MDTERTHNKLVTACEARYQISYGATLEEGSPKSSQNDVRGNPTPDRASAKCQDSFEVHRRAVYPPAVLCRTIIARIRKH